MILIQVGNMIVNFNNVAYIERRELQSSETGWSVFVYFTNGAELTLNESDGGAFLASVANFTKHRGVTTIVA